MAARILLLAMSAALAGCATTESLVVTPQVTLTSVELEGISFRKQTFLLGFEVANPNPFPLPVESIRYSVSLDNQKFAGGETQASFTIPAKGSNAFEISVELDILERAAQVTSLLQRGLPDDVTYQVDGSLTVDIPFTRPLSFSSSGMIAVAN